MSGRGTAIIPATVAHPGKVEACAEHILISQDSRAANGNIRVIAPLPCSSQAQAVAKQAHQFSDAEHLLLQATYAESSLPPQSTKQALASKIGTDILQVSNWFEARLTEERTAKLTLAKAAESSEPFIGVSLLTDTAATAARQMKLDDIIAMNMDIPAPLENPGSVPQDMPGLAAADEGGTPAGPEVSGDGAHYFVSAVNGSAPGNAPTPMACTPPAVPVTHVRGSSPAVHDVIDLCGDDVTPVEIKGPPLAQAAGPQSSGLKPRQLHTTPAAEAALTAAQREELLLQYTREMSAVEERVRAVQPLAPLPAAGAVKRTFDKSEALPHILGSSEPLSTLTQQLWRAHVSGDSSKPLAEVVVRNVIIDIAARRSCGVKDGRAEKVLNVLEDTTPEFLWKWEARDLKSVPKAIKPAAMALKKRLAEAQNRITALKNACKALSAPLVGKGGKRLADALAKVAKGATPEMAVKASASKALSDEREAKRAAKEAKLAADRLTKEEGRNQKTAHREEERIQKEKAKAAKLAAKKAPLKGQRSMMNFVKMTPAKDEGAAAAADGTPAAGATPAARTADGACPPTAGPSTTPPALPYHAFFSPPPAERCAAPLTAVTEGLDAALAAAKGAPPAEAMDWVNQLRRRWRGLRPRPSRIYGLPPSWARAPDAEQTLPGKLLERFGEDVAASGMKTWRRKLLWFPADTKEGLPIRPAFYGSWSKKSAEVGPRRPRVKDTSNKLDYDVMSDQDWEPEPEGGESLSDDDEKSEDEAAEPDGGAADSFVVSDAHLSAEELQDSMHDLQDMNADTAESCAVVDEGGQGAVRARLVAQLQHKLEQHQRACKPLTLCCMDPHAMPVGDCTMLRAFSAQVLTAGLFIKLPEDPAEAPERTAQPQAVAVPEGAGGASAAPGPGRPSALSRARKDALLPLLITFVRAHSQLKVKTQLIASFLARHPESSKNWVETQLKEVATLVDRTWCIKEGVLAAHGMQASSENLDPLVTALPAAGDNATSPRIAHAGAVPPVQSEGPQPAVPVHTLPTPMQQ